MAASGLTYVQIVNQILKQLREATVTNYNDTTYSTMVADLVNQVKTEIEQAWMWHALRDTYSVTTTNNTSQYSLTGSGQFAQIVDAWNTTQGFQLGRGTVDGFNRKFFGTGSAVVQTGQPTQYLKAGLDGNLDVAVDVWPIPVTGNLPTLKFNVYKPTADISSNSTVPLIPQDLLIKEVVARLKFEKGEDNAPGPQAGESFILRDQLAWAIMADGGTDPTETDWVAV